MWAFRQSSACTPQEFQQLTTPKVTACSNGIRKSNAAASHSEKTNSGHATGHNTEVELNGVASMHQPCCGWISGKVAPDQRTSNDISYSKVTRVTTT